MCAIALIPSLKKPPTAAIEVGEADLALINDSQWKEFLQNEIQAALAGGIRKSVLDLTCGWAACVSVHIAAGAGAERILACNVNECQVQTSYPVVCVVCITRQFALEAFRNASTSHYPLPFVHLKFHRPLQANFVKRLGKMETEKRKGMQYVAPQERDRQLVGVAGCDIVRTGPGLLSLPHSQDDRLSAKYDVLLMADLVEVIIPISVFSFPKFTDNCMYCLSSYLLQGSSGLLRQGALADILYAAKFLMNDGFRMVPGVIKTCLHLKTLG